LNHVWLFVSDEVFDLFFLYEIIFVKDTFPDDFSCISELDELTVWFIVFEITKFTCTVEGIHKSTQPVFLAFNNLSFGHVHDPVVLF